MGLGIKSSLVKVTERLWFCLKVKKKVFANVWHSAKNLGKGILIWAHFTMTAINPFKCLIKTI